LEQIWRECSALTGDVQAISHELHPSLLDNLGLVVAIRSFCRELSEHADVVVEFTANNVSDSLPREVSLALFRLVQETLHNSLKYSGAEQFHVDLQGAGGQLVLEVWDLGVGFDVASAMRKGHLGLISMRERVHLVGGNITIESKPNYGTRVRASIPVAGSCEPTSVIPSRTCHA
jgi:signal transduction histidine kinase